MTEFEQYVFVLEGLRQESRSEVVQRALDRAVHALLAEKAVRAAYESWLEGGDVIPAMRTLKEVLYGQTC
jgi:hypothetical protein